MNPSRNSVSLHALCLRLLALGLVTICALSAHADTITKLERACGLLQMRDYPAARDAFFDALNQDSKCAEASAGLATCDLYAGDPGAAQRRFAEIVAVAPRFALAHEGLGLCAYRSGDFAGALREYRLAASAESAPLPGARASVAFLCACLGQYAEAQQAATEALAADPGDALASYVRAASLYATSRPSEALGGFALPRLGGAASPPGIGIASCLFAPGTRYFADNSLADETRFARLEAAGVRVASGQPGFSSGRPSGAAGGDRPGAAAAGLTITYPKSGTVVSRTIEVTVEETGKAPVDYIAVLLDQEFAGMSNARPFRVNCDTRHATDGARELRVDAYGPDGSVVAHATASVIVQNGNRTLSDQELAARAAASRVIGRELMMRPDPMLDYQLAGACLQTIGRVGEAANAFEAAFAFRPDLPGIRADLLVAYANMGLLQLNKAHEVHSLPPGSGRSVALTFDDGPHPIVTPFILDLLDQYGAKATFFLVGKQVELYPDLAREIVRRGHIVGVHGYTHTNLRKFDQLGVERELIKARAAIREATGIRAVLFRPPGGNYNQAVRQATATCGFTAVFWDENITSYPGWTGPAITAAMIPRLRDGGIVLLHNGEDETPQTLPLLLPALRAKGCRLDTIYTLTGIKPWVEGGGR